MMFLCRSCIFSCSFWARWGIIPRSVPQTWSDDPPWLVRMPKSRHQLRTKITVHSQNTTFHCVLQLFLWSQPALLPAGEPHFCRWKGITIWSCSLDCTNLSVNKHYQLFRVNKATWVNETTGNAVCFEHHRKRKSYSAQKTRAGCLHSSPAAGTRTSRIQLNGLPLFLASITMLQFWPELFLKERKNVFPEIFVFSREMCTNTHLLPQQHLEFITQKNVQKLLHHLCACLTPKDKNFYGTCTVYSWVVK